MRIILTGGGTGGHIVPNLSVIEELKDYKNLDLLYVGSKNGPEKELIEKENIPYKAISCGKLRRYFSWENFKDFFRFFKGISEAYGILKEFNPDVIFSKGGYVSLPVAFAARLLGTPLIVHESDVTPGIANKIAMRFAKTICVSFEETKNLLSKSLQKRTVFTGNPVRESLLKGKKSAGYEFTKLSDDKPIILVMGGSQGAEQINKLVRENLDRFLEKFQIIHICGEGKKDSTIRRKSYVQYEYLNEEMKNIYAISDLVVSRGGANSLAELAYLKKKAVIIPLSAEGSRGDQIENARIFAKKFGWSLLYGDISKREFGDAVELAFFNNMNLDENIPNGSKKIAELILKYNHAK